MQLELPQGTIGGAIGSINSVLLSIVLWGLKDIRDRVKRLEDKIFK